MQVLLLKRLRYVIHSAKPETFERRANLVHHADYDDIRRWLDGLDPPEKFEASHSRQTEIKQNYIRNPGFKDSQCPVLLADTDELIVCARENRFVSVVHGGVVVDREDHGTPRCPTLHGAGF